MRILITGANGQLGCELRHVLATGASETGAIHQAYSGAAVHAGSLDGAGDAGGVDGGRILEAGIGAPGTGTETGVRLDITDEAAVRRLFSKGGYDLVLNCAAYTNVDACEEQRELAWAVNSLGPAILARAAEEHGAKLVHVSTDYVFSGDVALARRESDGTGPVSAYGASKLAGELAVSLLCERHFIVRTAWLYGYRGPNFVETILRAAAEKGSVKVVNDQFGNPTNANDLAHAILSLALSDQYGVYHATCQGSCSWFDFASAAIELAGIECERTPCTSDEFPRAAKRPAYSSLDNAKLLERAGVSLRPWREALASYVSNRPQRQAHMRCGRL
jgi:dTDP-4-dehydrorhamnose reductase